MIQNNLYNETYSKLIESNSPVAASGLGNKSHLEIVYLVKNITDNLTLTKDDVVADIGCGSGLLTIPIAGQVKKILWETSFLRWLTTLKTTANGAIM